MKRPTDLSDEELVSRLEAMAVEGGRLLARVVVHLVEIEERRLHLKAACSSLFEFCVRRLGMSEGAAFRRMTAARLVRRFPGLLPRIEHGTIHLSALVLLRDHLNEANVDELVDAAAGKSKREVMELLARRTPRPDVPATLRKLPASRCSPPCTGSEASYGSSNSPGRRDSPGLPDSATTPGPTRVLAGGVVPDVRARASIEPLSEARYKLQMTASIELRDKLERARDLMRHSNPSGDLAVVVERALDALLEKLEKQRLGMTKRPAAPREPRAKRPNGITRAVRRAVFARDGEQCTFLDEGGRRCAATTFLELDHVESRALGGTSDAANLRVYCRVHNRLHAEQGFGRKHVTRRIHLRQRKSRRGIPAKMDDDAASATEA